MTTSVHTPHARDLAASRVHVRRLHRMSIWCAQGNQAAQVHLIQAYVRYMLIDRVPLDLTARHALRERALSQRIPAGHMPVPDPVRRAQLDFWWSTMWDILIAEYAGTPQIMPSRAELDQRIQACGGAEMSAFSDDQMTEVARALSRYRRGDVAPGPQAVIDYQLLPVLIDVELGFQGGLPSRYAERPRTDGGDVHESRLLGQCRRALAHVQAGTPDIIDRIYRAICARLSWLTDVDAYDPVHDAYRRLIAAYNRHHPANPVQRLHVPIHQFPARSAAAAAPGALAR